MADTPSPIIFLYADEAAYLSLDRRVAWSAFVVERVLLLLSRHFRTTYHQQDAVEYAWQFALAGSDEPSRRTEIARLIDESYPGGEDEGYPGCFFRMGLCLLDEIEFATGHNACRAIDHASLGFAYWQGYRLGIDLDDPAIPQTIAQSAALPVYRLAEEAFRQAGEWRGGPVCRETFAGLELPAVGIDVPAEVLRRVTLKPPAAEAP
jgi:hypothetical protein